MDLCRFIPSLKKYLMSAKVLGNEDTATKAKCLHGAHILVEGRKALKQHMSDGDKRKQTKTVDEQEGELAINSVSQSNLIRCMNKDVKEGDSSSPCRQERGIQSK